MVKSNNRFTFVATKVTKVLFSFEASWPHLAFTLQIIQNHELKQLPYCVRTLACASANIYYAPSYAHGQQFCLISPEANCVCLNQNLRNYRMRIMSKIGARLQIKNVGKGLTEKRAWVFCPWVEAFFCLDLLVTFGSSQK